MAGSRLVNANAKAFALGIFSGEGSRELTQVKPSCTDSAAKIPANLVEDDLYSSPYGRLPISFKSLARSGEGFVSSVGRRLGL